MAEKDSYNIFFNGSEEAQYYDYDSPTSSHRPAPKPPIHQSPFSQSISNISGNNNNNNNSSIVNLENSNPYLAYAPSRKQDPPPRKEEPSYPPPPPPLHPQDSYHIKNFASNPNSYNLHYKQENQNHATQEILNPPRLTHFSDPREGEGSQISDTDRRYERAELKDLLLKIGFFLICLFIISIIIIAILALVNQQKCKNLDFNDAAAVFNTSYISSQQGNTPWKFLTSGKFIDAEIIVNSNNPAKQDPNRVYFETRMISARDGDVNLVDLSQQQEFLFVHSGNVKSLEWENYLTFPPTCAKVRVDLWFAQNASFPFSVDVQGSDFVVKGWPTQN
ncbi:109_t:CDS:10 [Ambispora leptoticha]|uniref:109_t:CDS:1 n=1 Tax=Ambispora leptoticha TaxID=144679 RepID=A0A9N8VNE3_9GLOM|nr:109_t:CDS:10 [Ambispora leptoticha]